MLSDLKIRQAKPGKYHDLHGLMLRVRPSGNKYWIVRYQHRGKRHDLGLGPYPLISLADARETAGQIRRDILKGQDPITERREQQAATFETVAEELIAYKRSEWKNAKHASQWPNSLKRFAYPRIGNMPLADIQTNDIVAVLKPIWTTKTETATRVRQRIEAVFDFAIARGNYVGSNPAQWRGKLEYVLPKPTKVVQVRHHNALSWKSMPEFMVELRNANGTAPRALELLILTASRTGEVLAMHDLELDIQAATWTIPARRMKGGKDHVVPLVGRALSLVSGPKKGLVFPSNKIHGPQFSSNAMRAVLKRLGYQKETVHGFRSTFRDWAAENTDYPRDVIEMSLAHQLKDKTEAAYYRSNLLDRRRLLLTAWDAYCGSISH